MPVDFKMTIDGAEYARTLGSVDPHRLDVAMVAAMDDSLVYLKGEVQKPMPVDRGLARGAITTRQQGTPVNLRGEVGVFGQSASVVSEYINVLEFGRRAGARQPPVDAIFAWMQRKGIEGGRGRAFVIARAIGRRGFRGRPHGWHMFEDAFKRGEPLIHRIFHKYILNAIRNG